MAKEKILSEGKCVYCSETLKKVGISKHLDGHLKQSADEKPQRDRAFHVRVEADAYFLNLLIDADAPLDYLDDFLRAIWLECCGHMSSFMDKSKTYDVDWDDENGVIGEDKSKPVKDVFKVGQELKYEHDFGSTTELNVKILAEYQLSVRDGIKLLARNEPLKLLCVMCREKSAKVICSVCGWGAEAVFCADCGKKHAKECPDFADYSKMKLVNSPRAGVCAYEGGQIDKKRDGIWKAS